MSHSVLVVLRHGQSEWNRVGRFQGWTDVGLSPDGEREAQRAGELLREHGHSFDLCSSSILRRAGDTARIVLETMHQRGVAIDESWRLNERHYGALQGLGPVRSVLRYGLRVVRCQKTFSCPPPPVDTSDPRFPGNDPRYATLSRDELPVAESLRDTYLRMLPYWQERIVPELRRGRRVLLVSHKNVLRGLLKLLDERADEDVRRIKVPTCVPIVFEFNEEMKVVGRRVLREGTPAAPRVAAAVAVRG